MYAGFNRFELKMTRKQAESASHPGQCEDDVSALLTVPSIGRQLDEIGADTIRMELREYGAWDEAELADDAANRLRITWIAACNIVEGCKTFVARRRVTQ